MNTKPLVTTLDYADRKEMVESLLNWLNPDQQLKFLNWCCSQLAPIYSGTRIDGPVINTGEAWLFVCLLCTQFELDFEMMRNRLERVVRKIKRVNDGARRLIRVSDGR